MARSDLSNRRFECPREGFHTAELATLPGRKVRLYLPSGYEAGYPYPLVVFFHGRNSCDQQVLRLAPRMSRRNFICLGLRGPEELTPTEDGEPTYGWGLDGEFDGRIEDHLLAAVAYARRTYHIHTERVYLAGFCEGSSAAYRLGLRLAGRVAGVISLNGAMPAATNGPLFRFPEVRQLRVFIGHGIANSVVPLSMARHDFRVLYSAGVDVHFKTYPTTHRLHPHMLQDINRWIIQNIDSEWIRLPND